MSDAAKLPQHRRPVRLPYSATPEERFWCKVSKTDGCWQWTASTNANGYGHFWVDGKLSPAHRVAYEWANGLVPPGLELDHLCRNRGCVRPDHLEAVTHLENARRADSFQRRQTGCVNGHEFTPENTLVTRRGWRICRTCKRALDRKRPPRPRRRAKP